MTTKRILALACSLLLMLAEVGFGADLFIAGRRRANAAGITYINSVFCKEEPAGSDGIVSCTHGFTLADDDVLYALVAQGDDSSASAVSASGWSQLDFDATATGDDRAASVQRKVIATAGSEPSSYDFDFTGTPTAEHRAVIIWQLRGVDTSTPEDAATTGSTVNDDGDSPDQVDITTSTNGAMVLIGFVTGGFEVGGAATVNSAPTNYTLDEQGVAEDGGTTDFDLHLMGGAHRLIETAGAQSIGDWSNTTNSPGNRDSYTYSIAVKPAS